MDLEHSLKLTRDLTNFLVLLERKTSIQKTTGDYSRSPKAGSDYNNETIFELKEIPNTPKKSNFDIKKHLEKIRGRINETLDLDSECNEELLDIVEHLKTVEQEVSRKLSSFEKTTLGYESVISSLKEENEALREEKNNHQKVLMNLKSSNSNQLQEKNDSITKLTEEIESLKSSLDSMSVEIINKNNRIDELEALAKRFSSSLADNEKIIYESKNYLLEKERQIKELEEQIQEANDDVSLESGSNDKLLDKYKSLKEVAFELKSKLIHRTELLKSSYIENKDLRTSNSRLNCQLNKVLQISKTMRHSLQAEAEKENMCSL